MFWIEKDNKKMKNEKNGLLNKLLPSNITKQVINYFEFKKEKEKSIK